MGDLIRFGIAMESDLLKAFDLRNARKGYDNRSEAIRDLIRGSLVAEQWESAKGEIVGVLSIVYNHHKLELPKKLTHAQHNHHSMVVATVHVHLDHDDCLEILILRGKLSEVRFFADEVISTRGVKYGEFSMMGAEEKHLT
ncbi:MAG: nickel-responsive transcriptional regulator NikR [Planctomycetes bacterium]|nr:nickel-responsive transcriptional regulator NikR [Planctomycetota bacterium]